MDAKLSMHATQVKWKFEPHEDTLLRQVRLAKLHILCNFAGF